VQTEAMGQILRSTEHILVGYAMFGTLFAWHCAGFLL